MPSFDRLRKSNRNCVFDFAGETQDIHIRVTHHHNFSPSREYALERTISRKLRA